VVEVQLHALAGGSGEQAVAATAERLQVVAGDRRRPEPDRELVLRTRAGQRALGVGGGPGALAERQRHRAGADVLHPARDRLDLDLGLDPAAGHRVALGQRFFEPLQHRPQLELAHELAQRPAVGLAFHRRPQVDSRVEVVLERRQRLRHARVVGVLDQVLFAFGAGDLVDAFQHLLQRSEFLQQLRGRFLADPGDAGDVVGGVAAQPHQVGHLLRRHPVALDHRLAVVDLGLGDAARGAHHPHSLGNQLVGIAVAGHDHHLDPLLARLAHQRGDHVVGLEAVDLDVGVAEGLDQRHQVRPLLFEQIGAGFALGLVEVVGDLAPGHARVPGDDDALRVVLVDDFDQHRGEAVDRVGRAAVGGPDRLRQGEEGAVGERVAVDQEELGCVFGHVGRHFMRRACRGTAEGSFRRAGLRPNPQLPGLGGCGFGLRCSGGRCSPGA
jgi:hypothetical protein